MKYKNVKIVVDGIEFDSKVEARYYQYLCKEREKGNVINFELQPKYILQKAFDKHGKHYLPIMYIADFCVLYADNSMKVIDIKGMADGVAKLKRKMYLAQYDVPLIWIAESKKYGNEYGFVDWFELQKIRSKNRKGE